MSSHPPKKRRRLDDALNKPFKSPMKTPLTQKTANALHTPTPLIPQSKPHTLPTASKVNTNITTKAEPRPPPPPTTNPPPPSTFPTTNLQTLQAQHTNLLRTLVSAKSCLETSSQALKIESAMQREAELLTLIQKWKAASRAAAEEVFAGARDRVNTMGGVSGMREREREREKGRRDMEVQGGWGWVEGKVGGDSSEGGDHGDDDDDDEEDNKDKGVGNREERLEREDRIGVEESGYDSAMRELERLRRKEQEDQEEKEGDVDEEGGYTMDMMLKTMNIDLDVVGFDKSLQKWVD